MPELSMQERFRRLSQISDGPYTALTILTARRFLRDYPEFGPAWLRLGIALVEIGRYEEAEQALAKALDFAPEGKRHFPLWHLGHLFQYSGDYERAAHYFRESITAQPEDATGFIYLGAVLSRGGKLHEAEQAFREATQCSDGCIDEAYLNLGNVLRALERFQEAAECYREAIRLDRNYRAAKQGLRDCLRCMPLKPGRRK
jgi:tetratricopeptide (TPR) repeat protein